MHLCNQNLDRQTHTDTHSLTNGEQQEIVTNKIYKIKEFLQKYWQHFRRQTD